MARAIVSQIALEFMCLPILIYNYVLVYPTYVYLWELAQLLHVQSNIIIVMQQDAAVRCPSESSPVFSIDVLAGP